MWPTDIMGLLTLVCLLALAAITVARTDTDTADEIEDGPSQETLVRDERVGLR